MEVNKLASPSKLAASFVTILSPLQELTLHNAVVCPMHEEGSNTRCSNQRGISLLKLTYKILTQLMYRYTKLHVEEILCDYQRGFKCCRGLG